MKHRGKIGCRPSQFAGAWAMENHQYQVFKQQVLKLDLVKLAADWRAKADIGDDEPSERRVPIQGAMLASDKPYDTDGPLALFELTGPMTKYPTSFQDVLGGTSTLQLRQAIRAASADPDVLGGFLFVDSPGGLCDGTKELADEIAAFAAQKPMTAFADGMCCSAAMWATSQATQIIATPLSWVGSIGTLIHLEDTTEAYAKAGVTTHDVATGPMKAAYADGKPITPEVLAYFQNLANQSQVFFTNAVAAGRELSPEQVKAVTDGSYWIAEQSRQLGLIDYVGDEDQAMTAARNQIFFGNRFTSI